MTETAITRFSSYDPQAWAQMEKMAKTFVEAKALPSSIDNVAKLMMVFQASRDFNITATEAINGFYFVDGKLTIYGSVGLAQVTKAGFKVLWGKCDDTTATVKISRADRGEVEETYTIEQAIKAGLTGKDIWRKFPGNMLRWKAFGNAARFFCPEALGGFYLKEELEASIEEQEKASVEDKTAFNQLMERIQVAKTTDELLLAKNAIQSEKIWSESEYQELANAWAEKKAAVMEASKVTTAEPPSEAVQGTKKRAKAEQTALTPSE